jgi:hypothetical protein
MRLRVSVQTRGSEKQGYSDALYDFEIDCAGQADVVRWLRNIATAIETDYLETESEGTTKTS